MSDDTDKFLRDTQYNILGTNLAEVGTDCISRAKAIDIVTPHDDNRAMRDALEELPPAQPERIKGHWIAMEKKNLFRCSECGAVIYSESEYDRNEFHKFCGRCGADMRGTNK